MFDLDALPEIERSLLPLGLEINKQYCPVGIDAPGRKDIGGLLPDDIKNAVRTAHPGLVDQAMSSNSEERRKAKQELKRLYLVRR
jgi:hypothetical protein